MGITIQGSPPTQKKNQELMIFPPFCPLSLICSKSWGGKHEYIKTTKPRSIPRGTRRCKERPKQATTDLSRQRGTNRSQVSPSAAAAAAAGNTRTEKAPNFASRPGLPPPPCPPPRECSRRRRRPPPPRATTATTAIGRTSRRRRAAAWVATRR